MTAPKTEEKRNDDVIITSFHNFGIQYFVKLFIGYQPVRFQKEEKTLVIGRVSSSKVYMSCLAVNLR